jgi:phosphoglycolate phosphatase-like HAD superfamily hydrolase
MIGDTPYDVAAARNAGVAFIGVLCGGWTRVSLAGAREIYSGPREIVSSFEQSMLSGRLP